MQAGARPLKSLKPPDSNNNNKRENIKDLSSDVSLNPFETRHPSFLRHCRCMCYRFRKILAKYEEENPQYLVKALLSALSIVQRHLCLCLEYHLSNRSATISCQPLSLKLMSNTDVDKSACWLGQEKIYSLLAEEVNVCKV